MTPTQIAWAAGLFEGEGCMTYRDKEHKHPYLKINMTDFDIVERFQQLVGCGSLTFVDKTKENPKWKHQLLWRTTNKLDVRRILNLLLPYFGDRRAHKALDILDQLELAT
jgi:hypothetical protein